MRTYILDSDDLMIEATSRIASFLEQPLPETNEEYVMLWQHKSELPVDFWWKPLTSDIFNMILPLIVLRPVVISAHIASVEEAVARYAGMVSLLGVQQVFHPVYQKFTEITGDSFVLVTANPLAAAEWSRESIYLPRPWSDLDFCIDLLEESLTKLEKI